MKFNLKWVLAALALALLALAAAPWTVSQSAQIGAIAGQIKQHSGLSLVSHGRSVFAILPRPHIRIYDPEFDQGGGFVSLSASSLRVDLGFAGLFTGRMDLARTVLADAVLTFDAARLPIIAGGQGGGAEAPKPEGFAPGEVEVANGKVLLRASGERLDLLADGVMAKLDWSGGESPLSLVGQCRLTSFGEEKTPARFALWLAQPDKLLQGSFSAVTLRLDDETFRVNLNGLAGLEPRPHYQGQFSSSAPSLRAAARWFGLILPLPGPYRDATIKGEASLDPGLLAFSSLNLSIDGNSMEGAASIRLDGQRPSIAATLGGASVNLAPFLEEMPTPTSGGQWSREAFASSHLSAADLDLRLSATHARIGDFQLDDAALSVILKNGRLDLSLAEASAYSGEIRARAIVAESGPGLDVRGSIAADKVDSAALLWDGLKRQVLTGTASGLVSFESSGDSYFDLASHLDARGEFAVASGEVYGLDLGLAFRRMERQPLTVASDLRSGRTRFDRLSGKFSVVQGQAEIEEGVAADPRLAVFFSGRAQMPERTVEIHAAASQAGESKEAKPLQLGFSLSGGWDDPTVAPDAEGLIRRSNAAAPLLPPAAPGN